jgi:hypothetical protein
MHAGIGPRCGHDFCAADGTFGLYLGGRRAASGLGGGRGRQQHRCGLAGVEEELLETAGRADDEQLRQRRLDAEGVRHLARRPQEVPGVRADDLVADVHAHLAVEQVERLVLAAVPMYGGGHAPGRH